LYKLNFFDARFLLQGFFITISLCLGTILISLPIAILIGLLRAYKNQNIIIVILKKLLGICIIVIRGVPLILQLMFLFFGLPFMSINLSPLVAALVGLSVYSIAYMAEIVRVGIESIAKEQWEAAAALGFNYIQTMRIVILPQAIRLMLPPSVGFFIGLIKDSSLCSVIGFIELARVGRIIVEKNHQSLLIFSIVALLYFIICYPLSIATQKMEKIFKV